MSRTTTYYQLSDGTLYSRRELLVIKLAYPLVMLFLLDKGLIGLRDIKKLNIAYKTETTITAKFIIKLKQ